MAIVSGSRLKSVDQLESVLVLNNFARASATNLGEQVMDSNISAQNGIQFATLCVVCPPPKVKKMYKRFTANEHIGKHQNQKLPASSNPEQMSGVNKFEKSAKNPAQRAFWRAKNLHGEK